LTYFFKQDVLDNFMFKAGGMRVSKKQESGPVEKNAKAPGKEKTRYCTAGLVVKTQLLPSIFPTLAVLSHKIHAAALQVAHEKPQPALEKFILPKRIYIIQQPRKC
uniref:Death-associated protein-like 1 n=1 Tax=Strix occidentalis caurina TaxID=311401 RepID=A0A8D0FW06_STROC